MPRLRWILTLLTIGFAFFGVGRATAQRGGTRILDGVSLERIEGDSALRIRFSVPILYIRHAPLNRGDALDIQLAPLAAPVALSLERRREAIRVPDDFPIPVDLISLNVNRTTEPLVEIRFTRSVEYSVEQGTDLRSLVVRVPERSLAPPGARRAPRDQARSMPPDLAPPRAPADPAVATEQELLMREGRHAMTAGEFERASALFTKVRAMPEGSQSAEALELLALARERKGQRAHAKAEYERYLAEYPNSEGVERVRQRLDALITAREAPPERRPPQTKQLERSHINLETFGTAYAAYRYDGGMIDAVGTDTLDSSIYTDLFVESRLTLDDWSLLGQASGGYRHSFVAGGGGDTNVSSLFIEAESYDYGVTGSVGRRSRSNSGVLGRYDGAELHWQIGEQWTLGAIGGLPVDSSRSSFEGFDRYFAGLNVEVGPLFGVLDIELFGIAQVADDFLDRAAIGTEIRYFEQGRSLAAFIDFDVYYATLNTAQVVATWQPFTSTYLTFFGDYRTSPTLTTRNALQGQGFSSLADLEGLFTRSEIERLAKDRTTRTANLSLSASHIFSRYYQLGIDIGANHLSGTSSSGGVLGFDGTGWEFNYSAQLIANDLLTEGDVGVIGLRYIDTSLADTISGTLSGRFPLTDRIRMTPRFRTDYRMDQLRGDIVVVNPALRFDVEIWRFIIDTEAGLAWDLPQDMGASQLDYFFSLGIRYDF